MDAFLRKGGLGRKGMWLLLAAACLLPAAGCGAKSNAAPADASPPSARKDTAPSPSAEDRLYEQLRSGAFQMSAAAASAEETLVAAREAARRLSKNSEEREGMLDVVDFVDSAGAAIAEHVEDPPARERVAAEFGAFDEKRLKAVAAGNEALRDLREALGVLEGLASGEDAKVAQLALEVKSLLAVALDDLWGAVEAYGGEPEASDDPLWP
jgi:post-segregation antitoxin (ccd killing protein)